VVRGGTLVLESEAQISTDPVPGHENDITLPMDSTLPTPVPAPVPPAARASGFIRGHDVRGGGNSANVASMVDDWENEEGYEATLLAASPAQPESTDRPKTPGQKKRERGGS
jgi:hypothetical protein